MKTKILLLISSLILTGNLLTQQWVNTYDFQSSYSGYSVVMMQFLNANTGFVNMRNSAGSVKMLKTTNKGNSWNEISSFNMYTNTESRPFFVFVNENTGYRAHSISEGSLRTILDKTTNGGYTWTRKINYISIEGYFPLICFKNTNQGYLVFSEMGEGQNNVWAYSTGDGFETSSNTYSLGTVFQRNFRLYDIFLDQNQKVHAVGRVKNTSTSNYDFFRLSEVTNFVPSYGDPPAGTFNEFKFGVSLNNQLRYLGVENNINNPNFGTRFFFDVYPSNSILIDPQRDGDKVGGMTFSDNSRGFVTADKNVYFTNNGGSNWSQEYTMSSGNSSVLGSKLESIGDVCYAMSYPGKFYTREIMGNFNTNFDWRGGLSGSIAVNGINLGTPGSGYFSGGNTAVYANPVLVTGGDSSAIFYYWGGNCNGSMNYSANTELIDAGSNINADYKTKLKSTTPEALKNANQVKSIKDTNAVTNLVYESMGGIFFTRTKPDGQFKTEEILSGSASQGLGFVTYNNKNPFLSEVKLTTDKEMNMWACWERREGNNIKIITAARIYQPNFPEGYKHYWNTFERVTLTGVPEGFECFPKVFVGGNSTSPVIVLTYLKPDGSNKKLVTKIYTTTGLDGSYDIVAPANIQEYAVAPVFQYYGMTFQLHIAYRVNQTVYYKSVKAGQLSTFNGTYTDYGVIDQDLIISSDNSRWRASLDITLKNMNNSSSSFNLKPVVTYQGRYDARVMYQDEDGLPYQAPATYYPIYVKERLANGTWSSSMISYSPLNQVQMMPNIEGSKHMNSCILNYGKIEGGVTKYTQKVPRWNNSYPNEYICQPDVFAGQDAKFSKGTLVNSSSGSHKLMTLSQEGSIYGAGRQDFSVTNIQAGDNSVIYDGLYGCVENFNAAYSFFLKDVSVNSSKVGFSEPDTTISDLGDLNTSLISKPFRLQNDDTLIINRNVSYFIENLDGEFESIEYWVKLVNKASGVTHKLLAHDYVELEDSVQVECLEGFVISGVSSRSDSFYVQLEIGAVDGAFSIVSGVNEQNGGEGDNLPQKRMIKWENGNLNYSGTNLPQSFNLYQNYPNPFNPATLIKYDLPKDVSVTVKIYDLLGKEVAVLLNNEFKYAGRHQLNWNASNYASGMYIYRIEAGDYISTRKMILVK